MPLVPSYFIYISQKCPSAMNFKPKIFWWEVSTFFPWIKLENQASLPIFLITVLLKACVLFPVLCCGFSLPAMCLPCVNKFPLEGSVSTPCCPLSYHDFYFGWALPSSSHIIGNVSQDRVSSPTIVLLIWGLASTVGMLPKATDPSSQPLPEKALLKGFFDKWLFIMAFELKKKMVRGIILNITELVSGTNESRTEISWFPNLLSFHY